MQEQQLGGNIVLSNFDLDKQEMMVVMKIVGNYAKKINSFQKYDQLKLELKSSAKAKDSNRKFEIHAILDLSGKKLAAKDQGFNVFTTLDNVLKKILRELEYEGKND